MKSKNERAIDFDLAIIPLQARFKVSDDCLVERETLCLLLLTVAFYFLQKAAQNTLQFIAKSNGRKHLLSCESYRITLRDIRIDAYT